MKIAIVGTRGIPNNYGGFEKIAEYLSVGLAKRGHDIVVYSPKYHPYKKCTYNGVRIKHIYSPEAWMGSSLGSFFYDFSSFKDAVFNERCDIIYETGYTSIIPTYIWFNIRKKKHPVVVTNMDGLEYKRSKFNPLTRKFLKWEERMTVEYSHYLIADNLGIYNYYKEKYNKECACITYGADIPDNYNPEQIYKYDLTLDEYYLLIARLEPENNIAMAIEGYLHSKENTKRPLIIVGKTNTPHGKELLKMYGNESGIRFLGGIYDFDKINSLRHFSHAYFHGHSVGGTNPSLLEAMASGCFVLSHDNMFNRSVLGENALYYSSAKGVANILDKIDAIVTEHKTDFVGRNIEKIKSEYSWEHIVEQHEKYFEWLMAQKRVTQQDSLDTSYGMQWKLK
ncbi:MAG: DUF1972 domain-containing protein [Prevotella sp.]|nr:DUF1972 domain-containing protein [Prevotella sp.]